MMFFFLSLAADILIAQDPLDDVNSGLDSAVLWDPSERTLAGSFCTSELPVFENALDRKECLSHGMEEGFVCVTEAKGKMGFTLSLNSRHIGEHRALSFFTKAA